MMPVGGGVPDAPQVSSSQRVGRRAASPLAAAEGGQNIYLQSNLKRG